MHIFVASTAASRLDTLVFAKSADATYPPRKRVATRAPMGNKRSTPLRDSTNGIQGCFAKKPATASLSASGRLKGFLLDSAGTLATQSTNTRPRGSRSQIARCTSDRFGERSYFGLAVIPRPNFVIEGSRHKSRSCVGLEVTVFASQPSSGCVKRIKKNALAYKILLLFSGLIAR
jgi:hypothetical protein